MGKDRLAEFQAASKHVKESDLAKAEGEEMKPLKQQDKAMSSSQETFFETLQDITTNIDKLDGHVGEIKKLQTKILNAVHTDPSEKAKLNDLNEVNKQLGKNLYFLFGEGI